MVVQESPLGGVQKAAFLGNRNEVTEMTKFHGAIKAMPLEHI